jgi:para-nitrobenzyl esterase
MGPVVEIASGKLEGREADGVQSFLGIPYAAPPIGRWRFTPPQPVAPWSGIRSADSFGGACPQPPSVLPGMAVGTQNEDCLFLNVYTPRADGGRRPVLVWIHGGGFSTGSGSQAIYDGARLARRGDVVVVTINYRLGPLGFLAPGAAGLALDGATDNAGLLDQVAALAWVRAHIASFGGDPEQVTIFGESAGGMSVATLLATPAARGLFHRAIAQSGSAQATKRPDDAARVTAQLLAELGLDPSRSEALREVPVDDLVAAQTRTVAKLQHEMFLIFAPVVDPATLPVAPSQAVGDGAAREIPLLTGTTLDEWRLFTFAAPGHHQLAGDGLRKRIAHRVRRIGRGDGDELIGLYRSERPHAAPWEIFDAIETDRHFRIPAIRLAEAQRRHQTDTYLYLFAWPSPAARGLLGACHAVELPFVFGTLDAPHMQRFSGSGPAADALSLRTMDSWIAFAREGRPRHDGVAWPAYDGDDRATMILDSESSLAADPGAAERRGWDAIL